MVWCWRERSVLMALSSGFLHCCLLVGRQSLDPSFLVACGSLLPAVSPFLQAGCALPRAVEQFHYLLWPDHGVPRNPSQLLCLVEVVNKRVLEAPAGPVLVHCRYRAGALWVLGTASGGSADPRCSVSSVPASGARAPSSPWTSS